MQRVEMHRPCEMFMIAYIWHLSMLFSVGLSNLTKELAPMTPSMSYVCVRAFQRHDDNHVGISPNTYADTKHHQ